MHFHSIILQISICLLKLIYLLVISFMFELYFLSCVFYSFFVNSSCVNLIDLQNQLITFNLIIFFVTGHFLFCLLFKFDTHVRIVILAFLTLKIFYFDSIDLKLLIYFILHLFKPLKCF